MIGPATLAAAFAAMLLPGLASLLLARRHGIAVLWAALIAGALLAAAAFVLTRQPDPSRHLAIHMILLPAFVSLVLGAAVGAIWGRR